MIKRDEATKRQIEAADPFQSTWLAANAGSGKTRVLTDRVARLLLAGQPPERILCLTYTKAAASEMQNRLFARLGEWAMYDDKRLESALIELGIEGAITVDTLRTARTLFARAIETPGGLKIQTIHSFCSSLLRRFPMEARVSPNFQEIEERARDLLCEDILENMAQRDDSAFVAMTALTSDFSVQKFVKQIVSQRPVFENAPSWEEIYEGFDVSPIVTVDQLIADTVDADDLRLLKSLVPDLLKSGANDQKMARIFGTISQVDTANIALFEKHFLYASGEKKFTAKIDAVPTSGLRKKNSTVAAAQPQLNEMMERIEANRLKRFALEAAHKTKVLYDFATAFLPLYAQEKERRGWLDFDDLILKARDLLNDPAVAQWVLYRLDGGIDHILVDEAQDTSLIQWNVIERLSEEFTSGLGARGDVPRTIFVVGDKKQSIYSFQGADPRGFDTMREQFKERLKDTNTPLQTLILETSFRSAPEVLSLVDTTFQTATNSGFATDETHIAFNLELPGRVDLWPMEPKPEAQKDETPYFTPVNQVGEKNQNVVLAEKIAQEIWDLLDQNAQLPQFDRKTKEVYSRPIRPKDFLILVQRRSILFNEIIRACKAKGLPIAGSDRIKVANELAVKDILALLTFLATPEDDLSLAVVLKSPLFGWDEQRLFTAAHGRGPRYLWQVLRSNPDAYDAELCILNDLRDAADFLRPYDIIERLLTKHDGRKRFLARLGREAEDAIDALLAQAMAYEQSDIPSLTGFLAWMQDDDFEIKRQIDNSSDQIRMMTVHGAKGLEAPIVIVPDTGHRDNTIRDSFLIEEGRAYWKATADEMSDAGHEVSEEIKAKQNSERDRLLYVAMTRAENWLIIAGAGDVGKSGEAWHEKIAKGMEHAGAVDHEFPTGTGLRFENTSWEGIKAVAQDKEDAPTTVELAPYFDHPATLPPEDAPFISPSNLGGAKALAGPTTRTEEEAMLYGNQMHKLLETLVGTDPKVWPDLAPAILEAADIGADHDVLNALLAELRGVLEAPHLAHLFAAGTLAEVPIIADIPELGNRRISGIIDRLIVTDAHATIIDFKTNQLVPKEATQCPEAILRQLGAYVSAVRQIYPSHEISCAVLWTTDATLMDIPANDALDALTSAALEHTFPTTI